MSTIATATEYDPGLEASGERADLLATSADSAEGTQIIAIYGKGGIGKSFTLANLSYMMAQQGKKVLLIGCDPKSDTTSLLFGGKACPTIIETASAKKAAGEECRVEAVCFTRDGVYTMELGEPEVGRGCGGRGILHGDHRPLFHAGKERNLTQRAFVNFVARAANQHVRLKPDGPQLLHGVLRRLRLRLPGGGDKGHQGEVDELAVLPPHFEAKLTNGFKEGLGLDIPHRATDFQERNVVALAPRFNATLDLIGDVGNDLHGSAQVVPAALLLQHFGVDASRGEVVKAGLARA